MLCIIRLYFLEIIFLADVKRRGSLGILRCAVVVLWCDFSVFDVVVVAFPSTDCRKLNRAQLIYCGYGKCLLGLLIL